MALSPCNVRIDEQGRELVNHGTVSFPIACYHDDLTLDPVPWHWHNELEIAIITEGKAVVKTAAQSRLIETGDCIFINANVLHMAQTLEGTHCKIHSLVFHPRLVGGSLDSIYWQNYIQPLISDISIRDAYFSQNTSWQKNAIAFAEDAWQVCVTEAPGFEFQVRELLSKFLYLFISHQPAIGKRPSEKSLRDGERIKIMLQFIQEHYQEELTTTEIAQSAIISQSECLRCFRSTIGITPIQYLKQFRIQKAAGLLASTSQKIVDIGIQCGFQEMSYFARTFKEMKGCTPSEYRKKKI